MSLFADNTMIYIENPEKSIGKLLEPLSVFGKVTGHMIDTKINPTAIQ